MQSSGGRDQGCLREFENSNGMLSTDARELIEKMVE
jgi:hypothetical protein